MLLRIPGPLELERVFRKDFMRIKGICLCIRQFAKESDREYFTRKILKEVLIRISYLKMYSVRPVEELWVSGCSTESYSDFTK
jgi:hypothetical protein